MSFYPVYLDLTERPCVVIGGGETATANVRDLLRAGAEVTVIAQDVSPALEALAAAGRLRLRLRSYRHGDLNGAWLAIDASWNKAVNARCQAEAKEQRVLLNVVDRPASCSFLAPAVVRRGPLQIAISTGGESPFLAEALRRRMEGDVRPEWGEFVELVGRVRRGLRRQRRPPEDRERVYRRLLASGVRRLLDEGRADEAERAAWAIATDGGAGWVSLVGAGPGDPALLTLAGRDRLGCADVVFHDALLSEETLALRAPWARLVDVGRHPGRYHAEQSEITAAMVEEARAGNHVVRLKGGDMGLFGHAGEELDALVGAGVEVQVVAGVSAALSAPAMAGIPLTLRGVATSVGVVSGHAVKVGDAAPNLERVAAAVDTLVVLMPLGRLDQLTRRLARVLGSERPAAVVARASLPDQQMVCGRLDTVAELALVRSVTTPATLIVGEVVRHAGAARQDVRQGE